MGKNIFDIFLKDEYRGSNKTEQEQTTLAVQAPSAQQSISTTSFVHQQPPSQPSTTSNEQPNDGMDLAIWQSIIDKNLPGPDYLELRQKLNNPKIASLNVPEQTKTELAFSMVADSHPDATFTKDTLIASIDTYLNVLSTEKASGLAECAEQKKQQIDGRKANIEGIEKQISDIEQEIKNLSERKVALEESIRMKKEEIATAEADLAKKEKAFIASIESVQKTLTEDKIKYQSYNF